MIYNDASIIYNRNGLASSLHTDDAETARTTRGQQQKKLSVWSVLSSLQSVCTKAGECSPEKRPVDVLDALTDELHGFGFAAFGMSFGFTYVSWNGPIPDTSTVVRPCATAKWCTAAGAVIVSPTASRLVLERFTVSPMPTRSVPCTTFMCSSVGWKCGAMR